MARTGGSYERVNGKLVLKHRTQPAGAEPKPEQAQAQPKAVERKQAQSEDDSTSRED